MESFLEAAGSNRSKKRREHSKDNLVVGMMMTMQLRDEMPRKLADKEFSYLMCVRVCIFLRLGYLMLVSQLRNLAVITVWVAQLVRASDC